MKAVAFPSPYGGSSSSCQHYNCRVVILMAKGKKFQPSSSSPNKGSEPTPPRITSNVKQNLQFLKIWKEFQKRKSSTPKPSTSYRRKKVEKEDLPEDTELYRDPTLTSTFRPTGKALLFALLTMMYSTNQIVDTGVPVLLVDGYNVCGYWAKLKKHFMNGRLDIARQKLTDELVAFSLARDVKVVVVFDAMMSGLPTHKENFAGVDIVFTGESCADAWIEKERLGFSYHSVRRKENLKLCFPVSACEADILSKINVVALVMPLFVWRLVVVALKEDGCPKVWVVTSDHIQQHAAYGAGAFVWSSKALVSEIKASQKEVERALQEQRPTSFQGRLLKHNLDSEVVDALKDLRKKLAENESKSR
ncbi:unnamed protein product [Dovyalis caffra]|uniref:YacP-like NYN domain protein n=1 Tax=Dovyalis caffra TaxID=77055 RepID=A0AAV1SU90_9ROSI|nr:unnamed protein product [Dovyalis caffra]